MRHHQPLVLLALALGTILPCRAPADEADGDRLALTDEQANPPRFGDLDAMIQRRVIRVLTPYNRILYFNSGGRERGATYEAFHLLEAQLNQRLASQHELRDKNLKVQVVFIPVPRGELLRALAQGKGDIVAANLTITPGRDAMVDFTNPLSTRVQELVIAAPDAPALDSPLDLAGQVVHVRRSSSYYESLVALNKRLAAAGRAPVSIHTVPESIEDEDLIQMAQAGLIRYTVTDNHKAAVWQEIFPEVRVHEQVALRTDGRIAWAIRPGSPALLAELNAFIARNGPGTLARNLITKRYLLNTGYLKSATSAPEQRKFRQLAPHFQKYGAAYDVDWLLMAAQGYQESRLDQSVRSRSGAIGVMQLLPATAKDMRVGDISVAETNIHAGIKYMRWLVDHYYEREPMSRDNKLFFALAAYNAGPGRVSRLRREAAGRGLDPNVWFRNVEYVASDRIGAETVTYVGNIYKYYLAYKGILDTRTAQKEGREQLRDELR